MFAMYSYSGICIEAAPARQTAMDTARMAFAPSFDFDQPHMFCVPSSVWTIIMSISFCFVTTIPLSAGAMISFTFSPPFGRPFLTIGPCPHPGAPAPHKSLWRHHLAQQHGIDDTQCRGPLLLSDCHENR